MNMSINFPHLGIYLEHVGKTIEVFGIDIAYYGIVIAVSMIAGVSLILAEAKRTGQDQDFYLNMLMLSIVVGIVGPELIMWHSHGITIRTICGRYSIPAAAAWPFTEEFC